MTKKILVVLMLTAVISLPVCLILFTQMHPAQADNFSVITTSPLPAGAAFESYRTNIEVRGGEMVRFATDALPVDENDLSLNVLPGGLALTASGIISGIPTRSGLFRFPIRISDRGGQVETRNYDLRIYRPFNQNDISIDLRINRGLRNGHIRQGTTSAVTAVVRNLAGRAMKKVDITLLKSPPYQGLAAVSGLTIEAGRAFSLVSQQAVNFNVVGSVEVSCLVRVTVERYNEQQHRLEHVYNVPKIASLLIFVDPVPSVPQDTSKI